MNGWKALGFETYQDYLNSYLWKEKRDWIIEVLGDRCSVCGSRKNLHVHHKTYDSVGNEGQEDVEVLCSECHKKEGKHDRNH